MSQVGRALKDDIWKTIATSTPAGPPRHIRHYHWLQRTLGSTWLPVLETESCRNWGSKVGWEHSIVQSGKARKKMELSGVSSLPLLLKGLEEERHRMSLAGLCASFLRRFRPHTEGIREAGGATDQTLWRLPGSIYHHRHPAATRGTSHLSVPRKDWLWLSCCDQTPQQIADYTRRPHPQ